MMYDVIILGAGPAGLAAGLYAGRSRMKVLIIEKGGDGGQIAQTADIENYPGQLLEGESGPSLVERMTKQCEQFGCERVMAEITAVDISGAVKKITTTRGEFEGRTVILATGANPKRIGCKGEEEYTGRGVSYCATCDGRFYSGLEVYVVGGGDAAVEEAIYLTKFARKVTLIHRRDSLRAVKSIQEKAFANKKMAFIWDSVVEELGGKDELASMVLRNVKTGEKTVIEADPEDEIFGLFGFVGRVPGTKLFEGTGLEMNEAGYIPTDQDMRTNLPGVFAAGDIRVKNLRQVITAAADGAIAATMAEKYLEE